MAKIYVFPADLTGCGSYRLIWPSQALQAAGHDVVIVNPKDRDGMLEGVMDGDKMIDVQIPRDADVMVLQRVTHRLIAQAVRLIREKGVAVVVDMDDDLSSIDPRNPAFNLLHPKGPYPDHSWQHALDACRDASMVTVSTPALLKRYAPHGRGEVFDNYVPASMLDIKHEDSTIIGWAGSVHSHPGDLQIMGSSVNRLATAGFALKVVGGEQGVRQAWGLPANADIRFSGPVDIAQWGDAVSTLGIGVAPLADTKFNGSKSWLKMAEYAASGVPCVASPRAEYARLHLKGVGWLASDPKEWFRKLRILATHESARTELACRGREAMSLLTIEANAWRLAEIWTDALKSERAKAMGMFSRR